MVDLQRVSILLDSLKVVLKLPPLWNDITLTLRALLSCRSGANLALAARIGE
jgi:hypothetical protein